MLRGADVLIFSWNRLDFVLITANAVDMNYDALMELLDTHGVVWCHLCH